MKYIFSSIITIAVLTCNVQAQDINESLKGKEIPGFFMLDFGINFPNHAPTSFTTGIFGSRTVNFYYYYELKIPGFKSHLSFNPGIGLGLDRFKFTNYNTLHYQSGNLVMDDLDLRIKKSQLITNYLDVPIELRYDLNPKDQSRSTHLSVGFKAGVLLNGLTKIKYLDDDDKTVKDKSRQDWNLNRFRYGVTGKVGIGNFSLYGTYYLSTLFKENQGPSESSINTFTVGISLSGF